MLSRILLLLVAVTARAETTPATYKTMGAIEVDTNENTIFLWRSQLYVLENIPCYYSEHASRWDPAFANASYARIRRFNDGVIVTNITSSIGFGFLSAFVDEEPPDGSAASVWLFGSACNRCPHEPKEPQGCLPDRQVQSWRSVDSSLLNWTTSVVGGTFKTYNVEVARVTATAAEQQMVGLPPHRYVMIMEISPHLFAINNAVDGDLTSGWEAIPNVNNKFGAPSGGPSIRYSSLDSYYYIIEGGHHVELIRTKDFKTWERSPNAPFIQPNVRDGLISPFAGFPTVAHEHGFQPMKNTSLWDWNSNDADVCCMTKDPSFASKSFVVWGAGTQGRTPHPPLTRANHCANIVGVASVSLPQLLADHFRPTVWKPVVQI